MPSNTGATGPSTVRAFAYSNWNGSSLNFFYVSPSALSASSVITREAVGVYLLHLLGPAGCMGNGGAATAQATCETNFGTAGSAGAAQYATVATGPITSTTVDYRVRTYFGTTPSDAAFNFVYIAP